MTTLEGKTILIVGGSSGVGFGVAKVALTALASHVIIASSSKTKLDDALQRLQSFFANKQIPGKFTAEVVDAKDSDSVKQLMAKVGEIDHLVWTSGDVFSAGRGKKPDFATNKGKSETLEAATLFDDVTLWLIQNCRCLWRPLLGRLHCSASGSDQARWLNHIHHR